jgi:hypothetical protein
MSALLASMSLADRGDQSGCDSDGAATGFSGSLTLQVFDEIAALGSP